MKKSQILAALALAFAMGIAVIPTANTYAYVTKNSGATRVEAEDAIYREASNELTEADELEDIAEYTQLYTTLEEFGGKDGALKVHEDWATQEKNAINLHFGKIGNDTIKYINNAKGYVATTLFKNSVKPGREAYAKIQDVSLSTTGYSTLTAAFDAIVAARNAAQANVEIIEVNYNKNGALTDDPVGRAQEAYRAIVSDLDGLLAGTNNSLQQYVNAHLSEMHIGTGEFTSVTDMVNTLVNDIKEINFDAYRNLVNSTEYNKPVAASNGTSYDQLTIAKKLGLLAQTARGLSKYQLAGAVAVAANNVQAINSDTASVDYAQAQKYIDTLRAAIKNYRDGKTDGTGEGTNKPGEGDNNGGNKAPDTGILANAEGNASTTVAMVAGIATALTAAGAGVVAYRNARRSSRK